MQDLSPSPSVNDEVRLAAVTPEDVHEVAKTIFADERTVWTRDGDRAQQELADSTDQ